jgi:hypothetical protein
MLGKIFYNFPEEKNETDNGNKKANYLPELQGKT